MLVSQSRDIAADEEFYNLQEKENFDGSKSAQ